MLHIDIENERKLRRLIERIKQAPKGKKFWRVPTLAEAGAKWAKKKK